MFPPNDRPAARPAGDDDPIAAAGGVDGRPVVRAILERFRQQAHELIEGMRAVPDAVHALPVLSERVWDLHDQLRAACEELLSIRRRCTSLDAADGRRLKHLLLERLGSAGAILESGQTELEDEADAAARARIARDAAGAAAGMLAHFLDMLASVERTWGL